jgi:mycothiol system anti-sigma-R factor
MNPLNCNDSSCERYRPYFDAYLDHELPAETQQDIQRHIDSCEDCARVLQSRDRMKQLVRNAVTREEAPLELAAALRDRFRSERRSFFAHDTARWMMAVAAVLILAIAGVEALRWDRVIRFGSDDSVFQTVSARVQEILRVGLVDHLHCAILAEKWKVFVSFDEIKANTRRSALGPEFIDLVPAVQAKLGSDYKIVDGHRCTANNRQYIHLILTGSEGRSLKIVSLVITEKKNESFTQADAIAVMKASGIPIYRDRQGKYEIAGFESDKYMAYVVSNLDRDSNLNVASALAPIVYGHLHRLEV